MFAWWGRGCSATPNQPQPERMTIIRNDMRAFDLELLLLLLLFLIPFFPFPSLTILLHSFLTIKTFHFFSITYAVSS